MLILTCPAQLQRLEGALRRSLPLTLPVYGAVMNINRGNPGGLEVVVDAWPEFGAVVARRSGEVAMGTPRGIGGMGVRSGYAGMYWGLELGCCGLWFDGCCHWRPFLAPGVRVGSLTSAHADLLNKTWPYGGNARSRQYLEELLRLFPSLCLRDGAGQPLCWALTDPFGAGTHGYTLPAHRRSGYMWTVLVLAARRAQARGFPSFG
ncbi:GLYL3 protein, partial [Eolophus roseicapillus]|nr:GLYL3 protein [Eolophus roseicapilla]